MPIPMGDNNMGSQDSFRERVIYDSVSFLNFYFQKEQIDLRVLNLFGKVDTRGNQILLPRKKFLQESGLLSPIDSRGEKYALSYIARPFMELRQRFSHLLSRNFITDKSLFVGLEPTRSIVFWEDDYQRHLDEISEDFHSFFLTHEDRDKTINFKTFLNLFEKYVAESCPYTVFTLKNYAISRFSDPLTSGMMIELSNADASNDSGKYVDYINDPNYAKFVEEAAYYGFIVDKHVPWRLVANPNSDYIKSSLGTEGFPSLQEMFSEIYIDPTMVGFEMFLIMLERMYEKIRSNNPQYIVVDYSTSATSTSVMSREKTQFKNPKKIMEKIGDSRALRMYSFVRAREKNVNLSQSQFDSLTKKALDFKKQVDIRSAIVYIDTQTSEGESSAQKPIFRI